jgi:hypothetical protein
MFCVAGSWTGTFYFPQEMVNIYIFLLWEITKMRVGNIDKECAKPRKVGGGVLPESVIFYLGMLFFHQLQRTTDNGYGIFDFMNKRFIVIYSKHNLPPMEQV